jgi:Flp pilus assembly protein CpaB
MSGTETSGQRSFFASPRNQRRLLAAGCLVLAAGVAVFLFAFFRNTGDTTETFSDEPADIFKAEKTVDVDPAARKVAAEFINTAVARKNLAASYELADPELRQGFTLKQWKTGNIPVVFYPTENIDLAGFKVDRSYKNEVVLEVLLVPTAKSKVDPAIFYIGLKRATPSKPWRVYYWVPRYRPAVPTPSG